MKADFVIEVRAYGVAEANKQAEAIVRATGRTARIYEVAPDAFARGKKRTFKTAVRHDAATDTVHGRLVAIAAIEAGA